MNLIYIFLAVLMFGFMICVHELGHFFAARLTRIPVKEFAIGFGPQIASWNSKKHETKFFLRLIPMGGYCMFYGEDDIHKKEQDDPRALSNFHPAKRLITVLMGPVMNIVLAFAVALVLYAFQGVPVVTGPFQTVVTSINADSPADAAGMKVGDKITQINGIMVEDNLSEILDAQAEKAEAPIAITVERGQGENKREENLFITPLYSKEDNRYLMGILVNISAPTELKKGSIGEYVQAAFKLCVAAGGAIINALRGLITTGEGFNELSGVVGVTDAIVRQSQSASFMVFPSMLILISINLGIVNLFPFPGLDGSRILFLLYEWLRGKPAKNEAYIHAAGMVILFGFIIFITLRDILRLF
ncbi:MAG: M50 family metallopeptidase [Eubacteriales bacterium]|nr:M50 family metallopeptidase [Eubacteriales bacterium]